MSETLADRRIPAGDDFLTREAIAAITPDELVARIVALKPMIADAAAEAERLRRPVDAVWSALRASGYFYMMVPRRFGGLEFSPETYIDATLPIAEACASTGWVASFCAEHNWLLAQFPEATQAEIWGSHPYIVAPSVAAPPGKAVRVPGGYRVSGRWKWGTGVMHADWVMFNTLASGPDGVTAHMMIVPAAEVTVIDSWQMVGMVGTGSNDIVVEDHFIPGPRSFEIGPVRSGRGNGSRIHTNPLYRAPMLPQLCIAAAIPALGVARMAVSAARDRMRGHVKMGGEGSQAEKPAGQMRLARADILVRSAELAIRASARENLLIGAIDEPAQTNERIRVRAQIAYAVGQCHEAVRTACEAGGSSVYALSNPMQRALRDMQVIASHIVYDPDVSSELHGRAMVGLAPNSALL